MPFKSPNYISIHIQFHTKGLSHLIYFLHPEVVKSKAGVAISQLQYTLEILDVFGLLGAKSIDLSMEQNIKFIYDQGELSSDPSRIKLYEHN